MNITSQSLEKVLALRKEVEQLEPQVTELEACIAQLETLKAQIDAKNAEIGGLMGETVTPRTRKPMSAEAKAKIAAAQVARWAKQKAAGVTPAAPVTVPA